MIPSDLGSASVECLREPIVTWLLGHHTESCAAPMAKMTRNRCCRSRAPPNRDLTPVRMVAHRDDQRAVPVSRSRRWRPARSTRRDMLNKPACLAVNHGGKATRYFHGIVSEFGALEQSGVGRHALPHDPGAAIGPGRHSKRLPAVLQQDRRGHPQDHLQRRRRDQDRLSSLFGAEAAQGHGAVQRDVAALRDPADGRGRMVSTSSSMLPTATRSS